MKTHSYAREWAQAPAKCLLVRLNTTADSISVIYLCANQCLAYWISIFMAPRSCEAVDFLGIGGLDQLETLTRVDDQN